MSGKALATRGDVAAFHHANKNARGPADHHDDSLCLSLKSTALADNAFTLVHPASTLLPTLIASAIAAGSATADSLPQLQFFRQSRWPDWVFTREVSLGPAFRSLAPPALA